MDDGQPVSDYPRGEWRREGLEHPPRPRVRVETYVHVAVVQHNQKRLQRNQRAKGAVPEGQEDVAPGSGALRVYHHRHSLVPLVDGPHPINDGEVGILAIARAVPVDGDVVQKTDEVADDKGPLQRVLANEGE
ncbi:YihY/virulence factor BrkB family protein [Babesia caballi]|uniref:YihY/virulence factor BrkB family protein n=1 Tax=Babesia caballi TaxID=5871 RepID=A0AAV4LYZ0_BABCB|nr:YihY/virulence factor BrkB family protein [Babesia caballi]